MSETNREFNEALISFLTGQAEERAVADAMRRHGADGRNIPTELAERWLSKHEQTEKAYARVKASLRKPEHP